MADKVETYLVTLTRPDGMTVADMKNYLATAAGAWCRGGSPEWPEWEIAEHPIKVKRLTTRDEKG